MSNNSSDRLSTDEDEWPRLTALLYDTEEAAKYISERTALPLEKARTFVDACGKYDLLLGVAPIYEEDNAREIVQARSEHADLLPPDIDCLDFNLLRSYVMRTTGLTSAEAANMIAENIGYYVRQGIMEPEAYDDTRAWANEIMIANPPK